jgi:hypothetical protein
MGQTVKVEGFEAPIKDNFYVYWALDPLGLQTPAFAIKALDALEEKQ